MPLTLLRGIHGGTLAALLTLGGLMLASAQGFAASYYFDVNGSNAGSGVINNGSYAATGTYWSTSTDGTGTPVALPLRQGLVFSAGVDATALNYQITGSLGQVSGGITVAEGSVTLTGGGAFYAGGQTVRTTGVDTSLTFATTDWDFYGNTVTFEAAAGCPISLNSLSTNSGRSGGLIKTGDGLLTLTGNATARTLSATVSAGELRILSGNAFYTSSYPPPSHTYTVTINGGTLELAGGISVANNPVNISGSGYNSLGALLSYSGSNSFGQTITLASAARIAANPGSSLSLNPASGDAITGAFALTLGGGGSITVAKPISAISALSKEGAGQLTLSAVNPFTGTTTISGGSLSLTESGGVLGTVGGPIIIDALLTVTNAAAQSLPNVLSGASTGQLLKLGNGTLTLTAASPSFAGATTISAGRLSLAATASLDSSTPLTIQPGAVFDVSALSGFTLKSGQTLAGTGAIAGAVTCQNGSVLSPGAAGAPGTLSFSQPLAFDGGVTALFDLTTTPGGSGDLLPITGDLSLTGINTLRITYTTLANGSYPLIRTSGGTITGAIASLQLEGFIAGTQVASLQLSPGGSGIDLVVADSPYTARDLVWVGNGGTNAWDSSSTAAWSFSDSTITFTASDRVSFGATGAANASVILAGQLAPGAISVAADTDYSFIGSGSLAGSAYLTKSGVGRLTLIGDHRFTGGTVINGGTVELRSSSGLGTGTVTNSGTLAFAPNTALSFNNSISGSGGLTQISGTTTLSGANTFTGAALVNGGILRIGNATALGGTINGTSVASGATLDLAGYSIGAEPLTLSGGTLANASASPAGSTGTVTVNNDSSVSAAGALTLSGCLQGNAALSISGPGSLTLAGTSTRSGSLTVASGGNLLVTGNSGPGTITVASGGTLGGTGTVGGFVSVSGSLAQGSAVGTLNIAGNLALQASATVRLRIKRDSAGLACDRIAVAGTLNAGGTVSVSVSGLPLAAGDTLSLFSAGSFQGSFTSIQLPYLYNDLIWDSSSLATTGTVRVISLPAVSTQAQRRDWLFTRAAENPNAIDGSVMAAVYFARGEISQGRSLALSTSRDLVVNNTGTNQVQVNLFYMWPAIDLAIRYGQHLDDETKANIKQVITTFTQYKDTNTANLQTLAWTVRYLGSELYGEAAFTSLGLTNYWRTADANARQQLLSQFASRASTGYPEFASRPYFWKDLLPFLSIGQLSQDASMRQSATMSVEAGFAQNAPYWMRGHLGMATGRSYPDVLDQFPVTSLGMLWFYFGGEIPALNTESAAFTAVMNQPISDIITLAGSDRSTAFTARSAFGGIHQHSFLDRDYALFSDGPISYGNFQVYPNGVVWCDSDLSRYSFLWVAKPWRDDSGITVSNPHGRSTTHYKEAQSRDAVLYIYNIPATGDPIPYALGYVPGGWRASLNEASTTGNLFLHYGTVLIGIRSENTFVWDPGSGIANQASAARPGDSEFRITGTLFAVAIETAHPSDHPGATAADQVASFRAAVLARAAPAHLSGASTPTAIYTSRRGDAIQVALSKDPATHPISLNALPNNYNVWPMLQNPWMYQRSHDTLLTLYAPGRRELLDFSTWTRSTQGGPVTTSPGARTATAGLSLDVDLSAWAQPAAGDSRPLKFSVSSPSLGSLALQADGHTARFTAPVGTRGSATFTATARAAGVDPGQLVFSYDYEPPLTLAGNRVTDQSGHHLDATVSLLNAGTCSLVADVPSALASASSQALALNEAAPAAARLTRALSVTEHDLCDASWTFATWVKRGTRSTDDFVLYLGSGDGFGGSGEELQLYFPAGSDTLNLRHYSAANALDLNLNTPATANVNVWHHVAVSFTRTALNTGIVRLYLDGSLSATSEILVWALSQANPLVIGGCTTSTGTGPAACLNGSLDETALFNRALSDDDIALLQTHTVAQFTGLAATVTMNLSVLTPYDQWRLTHFGSASNTGSAADNADPDGDGLGNLMEYALGTHPRTADANGALSVSLTDERLQITFNRIADPALTYSVQASSDLASGSWSTIWTSSGASNLAGTITVQDTQTITSSVPPRRFLRLQVNYP